MSFAPVVLGLTPAGWLLLFHFALKKLPPVQEALGLKWVLIYDIAGCLHGLACCRMPCRCACMHMLPGLKALLLRIARMFAGSVTSQPWRRCGMKLRR